MVRIWNTDDEKYDVRLFQDSDNELVDEFRLDEFPDVYDDFEDMPEGRYYITIAEVGNPDNTDRTTGFYIEDDEYREFWIKSPGRITGDDAGEDEGTVEVCNRDDEEYRVELYRTDGSMVDQFELEQWYEIRDVCNDFGKVAEGEYYIVINERGSGNSDISDTFYVDGGETEFFIIESPGIIENLK
jgi:hypothetical protein